MTETTQLRAGDLVLASRRRGEPDFDAHSRNGILLHSEVRKEKTMDHILRTKAYTNGFANRSMHHADAQHIIFGRRIVSIQSNGIGSRDQFVVSAAELTVRAGIVEVPRKL